MKKITGIDGIASVMNRLNTKFIQYNAMSLPGMLEAAAHIRYDMDKTPPLIPIDEGNLRGSWFASPIMDVKTKAPGVVMGFSANYAVFVHEMVGANFSRPGSGARFFYAALKRNQKKILKIMQNNMK